MKLTRQLDQMDCGPACVCMVADYYGRSYSLSYLRSLSHLTREGVSITGIRSALKQIGFESASFEMTVEQLHDMCPVPAILHWEQNHFVVLYKVRFSKLFKQWRYYVANPAYGKIILSEKELLKYWVNGNQGIAIAVEPTSDFYKKNVNKKSYSLLGFAKTYVWPFRRELFQLSLGLLCGTLLSLITPFLTQAVVDNGIHEHDINIITSILFAQLSLFVGSFTIRIISSWVTLYVGTKISIHVLCDFLCKLLKLPITFFETKSMGDYNQRIGDHSRLQGFTTQATLNTIFSILSSVVLLSIIGYYNLYVLFVYLFFTGIATLWMGHFFKRRKSLDYESFRISARNQNKLYEMMSGIIDIKVNAYGAYKIDEWRGIQEVLYQTSQRVLRLGQIQDTGYTMISQIRNILITYWIATEVVQGNLTLGMMMSISNIIGQVSGPLSQLLGFLQQFQDAKISLERSEEVYLCENEDKHGLKEIPNEMPLDINISQLSFSYNGSLGKPILKDISFSVPAGKMTAIVGESGSGKTTIMKLLLKFYEIEKGIVTWGGVSISKYAADSIRRQTGVVMQENFIFSDTIKQNIILGEDFNESRFRHAIELSCLSEYVDSLPLGVYTRIGTDGIGVSGGEKQRIMLARAIYKRPQYIMLDEATSSLDAETERKITENIASEFRGKTLLVIAHRLSTVRRADNIIVLQRGRVVEVGTHHALIAQKGYYYKLVKNQLEIPNT